MQKDKFYTNFTGNQFERILHLRGTFDSPNGLIMKNLDWTGFKSRVQNVKVLWAHKTRKEKRNILQYSIEKLFKEIKIF